MTTISTDRRTDSDPEDHDMTLKDSLPPPAPDPGALPPLPPREPAAAAGLAGTSLDAVPPSPSTASASSDGPRVQGLTRLLRVVGAGILLVAASVFLFQQWDHGNDLVRYASLGGMTLLLSLAGFLCASKIGESKSARTLLGIVLAILPVHFAVLGGFVYSQISWDGLPVSVPAFATWTASSPMAALLLSLAASSVLGTLAYLSSLTLVRPSAKRFTLLYLGLNASLLLPFRTPTLIALLAGGLGLLVLAFELRRVPAQSSWRTPEGRFCRALLMAPIAMMVGRCILYRPSVALAGALILVASFALHRLADRFSSQREVRRLLRVGAASGACIGWLAVAAGVLEGLRLPDGLLLPFVLWPCSALLLAAAQIGGRERTLLRSAGLLVAIAAAALNLALAPDAVTAFIALTLGIATLAYGYWSRSLLVSGSAVLVAGFGLWHEMVLAVELFGIGRWGALAFLGTAIIVASALLERHGDALRALQIRRRRARDEAVS